MGACAHDRPKEQSGGAIDPIDRDAEFEEKLLETQIQRAAKFTPSAQATGRCLFCNKRVRKGLRWCDADCRDDWELRQGRGK